VLGVAALLGAWGTGAQAITYNVTIVQFETGQESFTETGVVGTLTGTVKSSNLPLDLTTSTASYIGPVGGGVPVNVNWTLSDGLGNELTGTFQDLNRFPGYYNGPLARGAGITTIDGGLGAFAQATGGGTFEVFARDYFTFEGVQKYEQVVVNRLQFSVPDSPLLTPQTDTRNVVVSVRVGVDNDATKTGQNVGGQTSDDAPPEFPRLTQTRSEYEYGKLVANQGVSESRNPAGDAQHWTFQFDAGHNLGDTFFAGGGTAQMVSGEGFYAGYTGETEWLSFQSGMGAIGPDLWTYSTVVIDRYTLQAPIPEPETYALMLAGLAFVGFAARHRRLRR
jgi:hypothetical protein